MPTYKNADGSYTTVPEGGGASIRTPMAPSGSSPVPINEGLASILGNPLLSKSPGTAPVSESPLPPEETFPVLLKTGQIAQVPRRDRDAAEMDPMAAPISTVSNEPTLGVPLRNGQVVQVPASQVNTALQDPLAAPVTTVPTKNEWRGPTSFDGFRGDPARMELNSLGQWANAQPSPQADPKAISPEEQKLADEAGARNVEAEKLRQNPLEGFFTSTPPLATGQPAPATSTTVKASSSSPGFTPKPTDVGLKDFQAAQQLKAAALDTAQAFEEGKAERSRLALEAAQAADDKLLAEQQELERQKQEKVAEATQKYTTMLEESQKPGGQLDAGRWWNSRGTGQKVAAVLGQALASFNAGWRGTGGPVDMIGKFVEEDLALQQAQLARDDAKQRQGLEAQGKILALTEKQYGDPVQAKAAARALVWENMDRQLALGEARAGTEAAKAKYAGVRASVAEEAAKAKSDLLLRTEQLHLAQSANAREWKQLQIQQQASQTKAGMAGTISPKELQDQVEGLGKDMQPLVRASGAIQQIDTVMGKVGKDGDVPGTGMLDSRALGPLDSKEDIQVRQAKEQLGGIIGNILSGAGMSDTEREQRLGAYGLAKGSTEAEFRAGYPQARAFIQDQVNVVRAKYHPQAVGTFAERLRTVSNPTDFTAKQ